MKKNTRQDGSGMMFGWFSLSLAGVAALGFAFAVTYIRQHSQCAELVDKIEKGWDALNHQQSELLLHKNKWKAACTDEKFEELMPRHSVVYVKPLKEQQADIMALENGAWCIVYHSKTMLALQKGLTVFEYVRSLRETPVKKN